MTDKPKDAALAPEERVKVEKFPLKPQPWGVMVSEGAGKWGVIAYWEKEIIAQFAETYIGMVLTAAYADGARAENVECEAVVMDLVERLLSYLGERTLVIELSDAIAARREKT